VRNTGKSTAVEPVWYESCWRCRCAIPNGLVRRRVVQTGVSRDPRGYAIVHYGPVSVCGPCNMELAEEERRQQHEAAARRREVLQLIGVLLSSLFGHSLRGDLPPLCGVILAARMVANDERIPDPALVHERPPCRRHAATPALVLGRHGHPRRVLAVRYAVCEAVFSARRRQPADKHTH
jgi:hypothetical protein